MLSLLFPQAHAKYTSLPLLGGVLDDLCPWLHHKGFPNDAIRRRVQAGPLLEAVLKSRGVKRLEHLTARDLQSPVRSPARWTEHLACALARSLTEYLCELGELTLAPSTPTGKRVAAYGQYLAVVRGLAPTTAERQGRLVSAFLSFLEFDASPQRLHDLKASDVEAFICLQARRLGRVSMQKVVATIRSFLRFLVAEGELVSGLENQVDSPRCFRGERLPRALPWKSVRLLLDSVDRSTPKGLRDYAMLLMIATYGLRVSEIAALKLDDISWRSRQLLVPRPKVGTPLLLPLSDEVASALLDYLRLGRAPTHRHLFLRLRVPPGPIESTAVCDVFDVWASRAGIKVPRGSGGPHCLRHSLAVHLLRQGTSVKTIGDLLGHRSAESTYVYLRLQIDDVRNAALPLPQPLPQDVSR